MVPSSLFFSQYFQACVVLSPFFQGEGGTLNGRHTFQGTAQRSALCRHSTVQRSSSTYSSPATETPRPPHRDVWPSSRGSLSGGEGLHRWRVPCKLATTAFNPGHPLAAPRPLRVFHAHLAQPPQLPLPSVL